MAVRERREFQRLKLAKPILATLDGQSALILDVGVTGAFIEHYGEVAPGHRFNISFRWQSADLEFAGEVTRTSVTKKGTGSKGTVSQSAVRFVEATGDAQEKLQDMMALFIGRLLGAQRANAAAADDLAFESASILSQIGQARRSRTRGYVAYLWDGKSWVRRQTQIGDQPRNGFTVAAYEDEEDLETLCRTYETADEEGRRLIRLVAELSVQSATR